MGNTVRLLVRAVHVLELRRLVAFPIIHGHFFLHAYPVKLGAGHCASDTWKDTGFHLKRKLKVLAKG